MKRFAVREVRGMCVGAGMFVVHDGHQGREASGYYFDRSEAEKRARWLNIDDEAHTEECDQRAFGNNNQSMSPHQHAVDDWRLHNGGA